MTVKISELPVGSDPSNADLFAVVQSGATNKVAWSQLITSISAINANVIDPSKYTHQPTGTGTVLFSDVTGLETGYPLKFTQGGVSTRHIITSIVANGPNWDVNVAGPPLNIGVDIDQPDGAAILPRGDNVQADILLPGSYANGGAGKLIARTTRSKFTWELPKAYLVYAKYSHDSPDSDSGNQPTVNVSHRGNNVFSTNVVLPNSNASVATPNGDAMFGEYSINFGDVVEIELVSAAGNKDCKDLTAALVYVIA